MSLLKIEDLKVHYPIRSGFFNRITDHVLAVDGVNITVEAGKTYGLVGESGSGKSTVGKAIVGLEMITSGKIVYDGGVIGNNTRRRTLDFQKEVQVVFQDNTSSLNPKKRIIDIIAEPIRNFEKLSPEEEKKKILELLEIVGMPEDTLYKYPHQFSGGQRQRLGFARAIACRPKLIIADEPVSALDLSVQAQVLNFMKKIQKEFNLSYIFISHDLGVVRHMCDYIYIMNRGRIVESGTTDDIYENPQHIYTKRLIAAIPDIDPSNKVEDQKLRKEVEQQFENLKSIYYSKDNKVFDLQKITDTHYVAFKKDGDSNVENHTS